jgi:hypothetical protein
LVCLGGPVEAAQLADELQRRCPDLVRRSGRFEIIKRLYIAAHDDPRYPINTAGHRLANLPPIINIVP